MAPGFEGDLLTAVAQERSLAGRTGVYDVTVTNQDGRNVALFRGRSYRIKGQIVGVPADAREITMSNTMSKPGLDPIEHASEDELRALQLQRLKRTLKHAYENVAHYKKAFDDAGVHPDDLKQLSDISKFPFTTKKELREKYPFGMFAVPRERISRIHASSGTTGKPTVVGYTKGDLDNWANLVARSIRAAGGKPGDTVHVAYGYGLFTGGLGAHYGAERLGCTVIPMSGGQTEKQVQLISDFRPDIIMVTPSYFCNILEEQRRQGIDPRQSSLRIGIFGAEPWTGQMRADIEAEAGIAAVDIYGLSEVMGPGVASECVETKDGPVVWEDHFYAEIINPDTGEPRCPSSATARAT
ncbi:hypothetical protein G6F65_016342 [Rhizopus arrhizus]|nr:hypothetical protein G6F65_016342 [Rhizopus arrhizus]